MSLMAVEGVMDGPREAKFLFRALNRHCPTSRMPLKNVRMTLKCVANENMISYCIYSYGDS
jgi:hypothetical protein